MVMTAAPPTPVDPAYNQEDSNSTDANDRALTQMTATPGVLFTTAGWPSLDIVCVCLSSNTKATYPAHHHEYSMPLVVSKANRQWDSAQGESDHGCLDLFNHARIMGTVC
eukprot:1160721-Pelagomonas_calceolata.AAC.12